MVELNGKKILVTFLMHLGDYRWKWFYYRSPDFCGRI